MALTVNKSKVVTPRAARETSRPDFYYDSGTGAMSVTIAPGSDFELEEFRLHCSGSRSGNLTVTVDHVEGDAHDLVLSTVDMGTDGENYASKIPWRFPGGTKVVFSWSNAGGATWGLEALVRVLA